MLQTIALPLDQSRLSESVIPCALDLATRCSAETLLLEVLPDGLPLDGRAMDQMREHSQGYLMQQASRWGGRPVTAHTRVGRVSDEICKLASEKSCDLIVMASHGRDLVPRWLLGSVAEGVLRQAPCPILLLRPPAVEGSLFKNILVPTDGSEASLGLLPDLQNFLSPGGQVNLLLSTGTSLSRPIGGMEEHFEAVESRLRLLDYPLVVLKADPVHDILSWSTANHCDLIAMSTHGRSGFRRFWLGSVTEKVARHALCPVLVFPQACTSCCQGASAAL